MREHLVLLLWLFSRVERSGEAYANTPSNNFCPTEKTRVLTPTWVPYGMPGRAWRDAPKELELRPSTIPNAGFGVFAKTFIRKYTFLGEYTGLVTANCRGRDPVREYHQRKHEQEMASKNKTHTHNNCASPKKSITNLLEKMYHDKYIKPIMHQEHTYTWVTPGRDLMINAFDTEMANWARFVNTARWPHELNVATAFCRNVVYYVASRDLHPGQELLCYYGASYSVQLNIDPVPFFNKDTNRQLGFFV